ncbi:hypothetical protein F5Y13DRAFT_190193 [Hypoxylon sp. FL1857]|nr:hypothetical protein F5Y13DRAFT_190193 [Hypoxylon sp. FL1857]
MSPSPTQSSRLASQPTSVGSRNSSKRVRHQQGRSRAVGSNSKPTIATPLSRARLQAITSKTNALISKRSKIDKKIIREAQKDETSKPTLQDWPRRAKLLRSHGRLEEREKRHLSKLSQLASLHTQLPSSDHTNHRDLIQQLHQLHSKFKRLHGPTPGSHSGPRSGGMRSTDVSQLLIEAEPHIDEATSGKNGKKEKLKKHDLSKKKHKSGTSDEYERSTNSEVEKMQKENMKQSHTGN